MYRKRKLNQIKTFMLSIASLFIIYSCENEKINTNSTESKHEVSQKIAEKVALNVFKNKSNDEAKATTIIRTIENITTYKISSSNLNAFYVFNYNEGGFSIVSADDRISPVLAYCDEGAFSTNINEVPEPVQSWMEEEKEIVQNVKGEQLVQLPGVKQEWDSALGKLPPPIDTSCNDVFVQKGPHLTTNWDQWATYNNLVNSSNCSPNGYNSGKAPTGCVATAMAQIMKFWHKPNSYNWANMPNGYGTVDTQALMRDIGNGWINYGCSSSSQESCNIPSRFNQFGYQASFTDNYDLQLVMNQVNWQPVILSGGRKKDGISWNMYTNGHAWVCDGYQYFYQRGRNEDGSCNGLGWTYIWLHMNWG